MPLINTSVPNLIQGVSQQPDATRFAGQCEEQENALSSVAEGLKKRPNTRHVARLLDTAIAEDSFVHFIDRDDNEKYVVILDKTTDTLFAYNIVSGAEATIDGGTGGVSIGSDHYLYSAKPREDLKGLTVADNTFLLNTAAQPKEVTTLTDALPRDAITTILQGDYEKRYEIEMGRSNEPKVIFTWQLYPNGSGWLDSFDIINSGYGVESYEYLLTDGSPVGWTPDFSTEGVLIGGEITNSSVRSASQLANRTHNFTYKTGITPVDESIYGRLTLVSGSSSTGKNADTNVIAQNMVELSEVSGLSVPNEDRLGGFTGTLTKTTGAGSQFDCSSVGHVIRHKWKATITDTYDFTIKAYDPLGGSGISTVYKEVASLHSLPLIAPDGFKVKVVGDADINQDDYYVTFETQDGSVFGHGTWSESIGPLVPLGLDGSTMPMKLVSSGTDAFALETITFDQRQAGDLISNPPPSFVNKNINNMMFFKNRLGFLTNDSVVFSEAGHYFNFYRNTVSTLLDSAPIDVSVASTRVTKLTAAVGFQENLLIFGDNAQFVMKGGELLTPKTVSITPVTNFSFDTEVAPIVLGSYVYFPFTRGSYTGMREYTVNANTDTYDSSEITEHVPAYIPKNIVDIAGTTAENSLALLSGDEKGSLYIYNYFWNNNQKVLSAWSKFTVEGEIRGIEFIESSLYVIITNNGETNLVEMPLESGLSDAAGYVTHLDMRVDDTVSNGGTTITLPYTPEDNSVEVYTKDGLKLNCTNSGSTVTLTQAVVGNTDVWVGLPYTMTYTFSEQLFKAKAGNGTSPSNAAKMRIRNGSLYYDATAYFKVKVTPKARDTYENVFTPDVVGSSTIGQLSLDSGFYRFPVFTKPQDTVITIENESALPSTFQSAEFESFVHTRSNRYG